MEADLDTTASSSGVIFALGGYAGGACLFAADGSLYYEYSALLLRRYTFKVGRLPPSSAHVKAGDYPRLPERILDCPRSPETAQGSGGRSVDLLEYD